jgi:hypothetical protein
MCIVSVKTDKLLGRKSKGREEGRTGGCMREEETLWGSLLLKGIDENLWKLQANGNAELIWTQETTGDGVSGVLGRLDVDEGRKDEAGHENVKYPPD